MTLQEAFSEIKDPRRPLYLSPIYVVILEVVEFLVLQKFMLKHCQKN